MGDLHHSGLEEVEASNPILRHKTAAIQSADFHSFAAQESEPEDYQYDIGFVETDRIDVQQVGMDPSAILYSQKAAPYGEQFPSYLPKTIETRVGSTSDSMKKIVAGDSVVYGKISESGTPTRSSSESVYDYYDYTDESDELKSRLGVAAGTDQNEKPMSFF